MTNTTPIAHCFPDRLAQKAALVENRLASLLTDSVQPHETCRPPRLMAAMRHAALNGGKRLRPFLVMAAADACGAQAEQALDAACALELVHCYSLVHDDLPSMDDDDLRRGCPTVHKAFDEATAILAGDALLTLAFETMAAPTTHESAEIRAQLLLILARASGLGGMVGGQMLDLAAEGRFASGVPIVLSAKDISQLQAMKTGALISASVMAGGSIAGASPEQALALTHYGAALGAAFQIADDILDVESSAAEMGKATAKDAAKGKGTLVQILGLEAAKATRDMLVMRAVDALAAFGDGANDLRDAAHFAASRKS